MADEKKFKFISPGVFTSEIDNSQLPQEPGSIGPVVVGLANRGPGMVPVTVNSFSELTEVFGEPSAGNDGDDVWRTGNRAAPTYGLYAAQAWLRNNAPLTFMRFMGEQSPDATAAGYAGWKAGTLSSTPSQGGAFGLFVVPSASLNATDGGAKGRGVGIGLSGSLAAIVYCNEGRVILSGTKANLGGKTGNDDSMSKVTGSNCMLLESEADGTFTLAFDATGAGNVNEWVKTIVSMDPTSNNFIRKVLNTNPTMVNTDITTVQAQSSSLGGRFWLGESYERQLSKATSGSMGLLSGDILGSKHFIFMQPLRNQNDTDQDQNDHQYSARKSTTGWFIAQDLSAGANATFQAHLQQKLFRLEARSLGEDLQRNYKVSIANISAPEGDFEKYGTFSILIRQIGDSDVNLKIVERFDNLNLNPASDRYIARVIGDRFMRFDTTTKTNREYGTYTNNSKFIRVVMDTDVERGTTDAAYLPFGVFGPTTYRAVSIISGSGGFSDYSRFISSSAGAIGSMIDGGGQDIFGNPGGYPINTTAGNITQGPFASDQGALVISGSTDAAIGNAVAPVGNFSASLIFPSVPLRRHSKWGGAAKTSANIYWGAYTGISPKDVTYNTSVVDSLTPRAAGLQAVDPEDYFGAAPTGSDRPVQPDIVLKADGGTFAQLGLPGNPNREMMSASAAGPGNITNPLMHGYVFTLDDIIVASSSFSIGSPVGTGFSYLSGSRQAGSSVSANQGGYTGSINNGLDRFTTVFHGGFDGFDITEKNPIRSNKVASDATEESNYIQYTLKRAVDIISDPDQTQFNVATMPGVTLAAATDHLLETIEDRGDALAIIDIPRVYTPATDSTGSSADRNAFTTKQAVDALKARNINNNFGATYSPWVQIQDTISNRLIWAPPSVAALGALSTTDKIAAPWFAPAGFTRGGLSEGAAGIPVLEVSKRLTSSDRDDLYDAGINPVAKFPAEGIVIFGQKTLQQTKSALDRINVRRLLIFLKREISFIASRLLFSPNTQDTWNRFLTQATPVLDSVKAEFGIEDFRLILDETTTTPDLIDRNIIYSKLIVKPTRSAEFFAIDFVITNSGAAFED